MRASFAITILLTSFATAWAQESPAALARKLGSSNFAERERAARALEQLGKPAVPALLAAAGNADLETRRRALLVIERIEDRVQQEDLIKATPVRLRLTSDKIQDALLEAEKSFHVSLGKVNAEYRIKLADEELPYWRAWQKFCDAAGIQEGDYVRSAAKLRVIPSVDLNFRPGLAEVNPSYRLTRIEFALPGDKGHLFRSDDRHSVRVRVRLLSMDNTYEEKVPWAVIAVEVRPEPRLEIVGTSRVEITKIVDKQGKEAPLDLPQIVPAAVRPEHDAALRGYAGEIQFGGLLHLKAIRWPHQGRAIKDVHGIVRVPVQVRPALVEVPAVFDSAGKLVRGFEGITLKIINASKTEDGEFSLRLYLENLDSLTPQTPDQQIIRVRPGVIAVRGAIDVAMERIALVDRHGNRFLQSKASYQSSSDGKGYEVDLQFTATSRPLADATLVLTKAPRNVMLDVPFVVRDLAGLDSR